MTVTNHIPITKESIDVGYSAQNDRFYVKFDNGGIKTYEFGLSELDSLAFIKAFTNIVYKVAYLKRTGKVIKEDIKITEIDVNNND